MLNTMLIVSDPRESILPENYPAERDSAFGTERPHEDGRVEIGWAITPRWRHALDNSEISGCPVEPEPSGPEGRGAVRV